MTKDEALRLALEALEDLARYEHPQTMIQIRKKDGGSIVTMYPHKVASDAITAIKAALEAKDEPVVWNEGVPAMLPKQKEGETFIVSYEPKLEAKDEPVAWRDAAIRLGEELSSVGPDGYYDMDAKEWLDWAMEQNPRGKHSLPQRTWVGLTDEEKIIMSRYDLEYAALIGEVERKLKELNT